MKAAPLATVANGSQESQKGRRDQIDIKGFSAGHSGQRTKHRPRPKTIPYPVVRSRPYRGVPLPSPGLEVQNAWKLQPEGDTVVQIKLK